MINDTLNYLRTNIIKEAIIKLSDDEHSVKAVNYPFQALEEAVVNALYHRNYNEREPVEITIEPHRISILSYSGPDRSISWKAIQEATNLRSRRYRNRRLGDFLKELGLTEGRATGIPTIQKKLKENGSPKAVIETDENRTYFLIDIPCREDFVQVGNTVKSNQIEIITLNLSRRCPRYVQDMSKKDLGILATCLLKAQTEISAQEMLEDISLLSDRQKKRKYLDKLIEMKALRRTIPDKPTSKHQKYILSDFGLSLIV